MEDLMDALPGRLEKALNAVLTKDEQVHIKLKGTFNQALICTSDRVLIIKSGLMTGHLFGNNIFELPYSGISGAEVKFGQLTGYFEMTGGGFQKTARNYWSQSRGSDPAKAANCVSLSGKGMGQRFRDAASFILERCNTTGVAQAPGAPVAGQNAQETILNAIAGLNELLQSGALTEQEFERKKQELLSRL
jgi:hypothetical protein